MISIDWKARLKKDTEDFLKKKLPNKDFDIDIIYNAYPERIDNKVPKDVVVLVSKHIASYVTKNPESHMDFFDSLWSTKGENGKIALSIILAKLVKTDPRKYIDYSGTLLKSCEDITHAHIILDKVIYPIVKKHPDKFIDKIIKWLNSSNSTLKQAIMKLLIKLIKANGDLIKPVFRKLEGLWLYADDDMIHFNIDFLKAVCKIDRNFYKNIFKNYKISRNPVFIEILTGSISIYDQEIFDIVENWTKSGNARLKKAALSAHKIMLRKKG